jgi:hypothetical protein
MRKCLLLTITSVALIATAGPLPGSYEAQIAALEAFISQDPIKRANASIEKGDFRLLGVRGYAVEVPGVGHDLAICNAIRDNVNIIEGTSDDGARALNEKARKYAARYNAFVVSHKQFVLPNPCKAP